MGLKKTSAIKILVCSDIVYLSASSNDALIDCSIIELLLPVTVNLLCCLVV